MDKLIKNYFKNDIYELCNMGKLVFFHKEQDISSPKKYSARYIYKLDKHFISIKYHMYNHSGRSMKSKDKIEIYTKENLSEIFTTKILKTEFHMTHG
jgi:hypothetical protein